MTVSLKHAFTSAKEDGADTSLVQPSNWNAEHTLTMAADRLLGRTTSETGAVEEISVGSGLSLSAGTLSASGSGWTQIGSSVTISSPAASVTFSSIPATYSTLGIVVLGASHDSGSNQSFNLGVSSNGGTNTYARQVSVSTHPASDALSGFLQVFGYTQDVASVFGPVGAWSSAGYVGGGTQNLAFVRLDGNPIDLVQLTWSGGSFDAGTFTLLGK